MAKSKYETSFDVDTIEARKDRALSVSKGGNLKLDAKVANPDYDEKAKKGTPEYYKMNTIRECFEFFILKEDGSVAFKLKDHVNLAGGTSVTAFGREWTPKDEE